LFVEEGTVVRKGQVVARLDGTLAKADLRIARARENAAGRSVEVIEAELGEAKRILNRTRLLSARKVSSAANLSKAESEVAALSARLKELQAKHRMAASQAERAAAVVAKHTITAPFSGVVTGCTAQVGETISPMSSGGSVRNGICTIVDSSSIQIELDVPETMIGRVRRGTKAFAILDAYPRVRLPATVLTIAPIANREKSTIKVRLGFERMDARLRPGMAIKVDLTGQTREMKDE
ncbi:MAG: efflux RND transporter periplasmic adaptor subunit, partial [Pseudomonadota bacterium]